MDFTEVQKAGSDSVEPKAGSDSVEHKDQLMNLRIEPKAGSENRTKGWI